MAGRGSRFREAGFDKPKPMIEVCGRPMIDWALESFSNLSTKHRFIFVALESDLSSGLRQKLEDLGEIISLEGLKDGAVQSALSARHLIDSEQPLLLANCDQYIEWDVNAWLSELDDYDGAALAFRANNPHHSYLLAQGKDVTVVREKEVISDLAVAGVYYYASGHQFVDGADALIEANEKTNGEFFISPIFNQLLSKGLRITFGEIPREDCHMLGTPEELRAFEKLWEERQK